VIHAYDEVNFLEMHCTVSGQVLGYVLGDTITDVEGNTTHRVVNFNSPGVLKFFVFPRESGRVVLKASRTWLPDHRFWFVPPRALEYSTGGWYVEWSGSQQMHGSEGLHPGIACCLLGLQALEFENGVHVPWWLKRTLKAPQRDVQLLPG
jgi:hypothetical protein